MKKNPKPLSKKQKGLLLAFGVAVSLVVLLFAEAALAVLDTGESASVRDPFVGFEPGVTLFEKKGTGDTAYYQTRPSKRSFFNDQRFPSKKPAKGLRIFALGGSTTFGRPYDWKVAFPQWLQLLLQEHLPETHVEVINAGGVSYASYRIKLLMRELLRYEPDLFVIYTGHNEFLEDRTYGEISRQNTVERGFWKLGRRLRTVAWLQKLLVEEAPSPPQNRLAAEVKAKLDVWNGLASYRRDDAWTRSVLKHFEFNLEQLIELAGERGVPILFVEPVSNLKDFSPFKSDHPEDWDPDQRQVSTSLQSHGVSLLQQGAYREAAATFERALTLDPEYAETHFRLGQAHFALGAFADAKRHFILAKDLDVCPLRNPSAINRILKKVAAVHGVPLLDLPTLLEAASRETQGHDILGDAFFLDHVHPRIEIHQLIAQRILEVMKTEVWIELGPAPTEERERQVFDTWNAGLDPAYYAKRDLNLAKVLGWAGKVREATAALLRAREVLADDVEVHFNLGVLYERQGKHEQALEAYRRVLARDADYFEAHFNAGKTLQALTRHPEAVEAFRQALRCDPLSAETRYNLALSLFHAGRLAEALATIRQASAQTTPFPGTRLLTGRIQLAQGDVAGALTSFRENLRAIPEQALAHHYYGLALGAADNLAEAAEAFGRALALDPNLAETHRGLAQVYESQNRWEDAASAYEKAIAARPGDALFVFELGLLFHKQGELEKALDPYLLAIELDPNFAKAHNNLGVLYGAMQRYPEAILAFQQTVALDAEAGDAHYNLAQLHLLTGNPTAAKNHLDRAQALGIEPSPEILARLAND